MHFTSGFGTLQLRYDLEILLKEIIQISTSFVAKIIGLMPLFFYLILGLISKTFSSFRAWGYTCDLLPNAYLEHDVSVPGKINLQSVWRNCSIYDENDIIDASKYNETLDPSSFTLRDDQMKRAMIKETTLIAANFTQSLQAIEITYLFLTSVILDFSSSSQKKHQRHFQFKNYVFR